MADLKISVDMKDIPAAVQATQRFERQINTLAAQLARGSITTGTYQKALNQLSAKYRKLGVDVSSARSAVMSYGRAAAEAARKQQALMAASQGTTRGINRQGVITQQAGYQIGDFIVQVQSGTNAFVAFGQQATQVAGTLTLLGGKFIGIGTVLGITIPLATALGAAFMRTREQAEGLTEIEEILQSIQDQARETYREVQAFQFGFGTDVESYELTLRLNRLLAERLDIERQIYDLEQIGAAAGPQQYRLNQINEEVSSLREALDLRQRQIEIEQRQQRIADMANEAAQRFRARQEETRELARQLAIQERINQYGEDSTEVAQLRAAFARQTYSEEARRLTVSEAQYRQLMAQYDALQRARQEADNTANAASNIAEEISLAVTQADRLAAALNRAATAGTSRQRQIAVLRAQISAAQAGESTAIAGARAGTQFDIASAGGDPLVAQISGAIAAAEAADLEGLQNQLRELTSTPSAGGGGGGGRASEFESMFGRIQEAVRLADEQLRAFNQEIDLLDSALSHGIITQQQYNDMVAQAREAYNQAATSAYDYQAALEQVEQTTMTSMENAFMSILDGSKSAADAFKDMARQILAEAMRMMVIRPLIQGIFGGFGGGAGGGFLGGLLGMRESGGSMMASRPYLVGERGPELVIPGRSSTVTNADLTRKAMDGSDGLVVNNNITVTGGNDPAAIRQEVARLMPQITNATKTAVIDARRRGGQMRAAFQ